MSSTPKFCRSLALPWQDEIQCQVRAEFARHGLDEARLHRAKRLFPIVYPWNEGPYNELRQNYNRRFNFFPMGIIHCQTAQHVQNGLGWVQHYSLPFVIRSGGHCYLPFSLSTHIILDVSRLNQVQVVSPTLESKQLASVSAQCSKHHRSPELVEVGPGALLGHVAQVLSKHQLCYPIGSCVNTAACGYTLGGGISPSLIRKSGLGVDHLFSVDVVLADGRLVTASASRHSDLFWALRGAGNGNFGIVVKLTLTPCPFIGAVVFSFTFAWSDLETVFQKWQRHAPHANPNLSLELNLHEPIVEVKGQWEGAEIEFWHGIANVIQDLVPVKQHVQRCTTFAECARFWGTTKQTYFTNKSLFWLAPVPSAGVEVLRQALQRAPGPLDSIELNAMRGEVSCVSSTDTAFPWRKALFWMQLQGKTLNPNDMDQHSKWVSTLYRDLVATYPACCRDFAQGVIPAYYNAPQTESQGKLQDYFGKNLARLRQVKQKYDPHNVFHFEQSIPL